MNIQFTPEIAQALKDKAPIVALESTIITHGMPFPDNMAMQNAVEAVIYAQGAIPATIAVIKGKLHIGLDEEQAMALAQTKDAMKLSRADMAFAMTRGLTGGTTVAATMMGAAAAGIAVFATGGIGGVHKGAETSFDISADLDELSRTAVTVVSAGAKAILDIPKTMEALETRGVPVIAFGQDMLPAFWSRSSGIKAPLRMDSAAEIADFMAVRAKQVAFGHGGILITNPVPLADEIASSEMAAYIEQAQGEAAANGVSGKSVTPWLLSRILEITNGKSLKTNIALVKNNAELAANIAVSYAQK